MYFYVYRITNLVINKHYYGTRSSKIKPKLDLGIKYFSSSSDKEFIEDQKVNPQNYKYKVVRVCENKQSSYELEIKIHNKFDVDVNESFYNKAKQTSVGFSFSFEIGTKRPEHSSRMKGENNPFYGKKHSEETKEILRNLDRKSSGKLISKSRLKIMDDGRTLQEHITEKRMLKMDFSKIGEKVSKTLKENGSVAGKNNPNAKIIHIFNNNNELVFECHGNFIKICDENNLPKRPLMTSYRNNGKKLYQYTRQSDITQVGKNYELYKDWYAIVVK